MIYINVQNMTYRFDNGKSLFTDISFTLSDKITGLIGRNGVGKSILASLLSGNEIPYSGSVTPFCRVGLLRQVVFEETVFQNGTISDFLGINEQLDAIVRIENGGCDPQDFELIGDDWLLRENIEQYLISLGLPADLLLPCNALSGGQLTRLTLQQLFRSNYDYLILDEPGNHLDQKGKKWLIEEIQRFKGGILIISHDRDILRWVDDILELTKLGIRYYGGAYDIYAEQRANELANYERCIEYAKKQKDQLRRTVQINREKAQQRAGKGKQLARSGSQAKILLSSKKQEAESAGGARENRQSRRLAQINDQLSKLNKQHERLKQQSLVLGTSEKRISRVLDIIRVQLPYINSKDDITLSMDFGDKIHVSGSNGCGKSTLLKAIAGHLQPISGEIQVHGGVCYLDQHFNVLDNMKSAQENLKTLCPQLSKTSRRTLLAGIGLRLERVNQDIATLSGGEKMKVAMLAVSHQSDVNLLLLDEPDNHLDMDSRIMLAQALRDFAGSILIVSHDVDFIENIGILKEVCLERSDSL